MFFPEFNIHLHHPLTSCLFPNTLYNGTVQKKYHYFFYHQHWTFLQNLV